MWLTRQKNWHWCVCIDRGHNSNSFIHSSIDYFTFLVTRNVRHVNDWNMKASWFARLTTFRRFLRRDAYSLCTFLTVRLGIALLSCFRHEKSETKNNIAALITRADLEEKCESKSECDDKKKTEMASRHAKCFNVLCVYVNENIFQKGDILLVRNDKTEDNRCAQSKERKSNTNAYLDF